jgi:hypothetical protein
MLDLTKMDTKKWLQAGIMALNIALLILLIMDEKQ